MIGTALRKRTTAGFDPQTCSQCRQQQKHAYDEIRKKIF